VVAAVNLAVAIGTGLADDIDVPVAEASRIEKRPWMAGGDMALLTEEGLFCLEQVVVNRGMGLVAMAAIFLHWLVFKEERAAFFRVALVTGVVEGGLGKSAHGAAAVGRVAIRTLDMAFCEGMPGKLHLLGALALVATGANLKLTLPGLNLILAAVNVVAAVAADFCLVVLAERPVIHCAVVAAETGAVAGSQIIALFGEAVLGFDTGIAGVVGAAAVAGCAAHRCLPALGISAQTMGAVGNAALYILGVTELTAGVIGER